jgi:hypothetical protein
VVITLLGSAVGGTTTRLRSFLFPAALVIVFFLATSSRLLIGTASSGMTTLTKHHVDYGCFWLSR